jgi:hypothetical protein
MRLLAILAASAVAVAAAPAAGTRARVSYAFGWTGGNITPATVRILPDGTVTVLGPPNPAKSHLTKRQLANVWKVTQAQRFFSLRSVNCSRALPDFATEFISVRTATRTKTVRVHGDCSPRFKAIYKTLKSAVGLR